MGATAIVNEETENDIIGATDKNNHGFEKALVGKSTSSLFSNNEGKADLSKEKRLHAEVVETYFPIYNKQRENFKSR